VVQNWQCSLIHRFIPCAHQVQTAFSRLGDATGHGAFQHVCACGGAQPHDVLVHTGRNGGAVNKQLARSAYEQVVAGCLVNGRHGGIIAYYRDDDITGGGYGG
jgi:hypothetical protein